MSYRLEVIPEGRLDIHGLSVELRKEVVALLAAPEPYAYLRRET